MTQVAEEAIDVFAPQDEELNPDGEPSISAVDLGTHDKGPMLKGDGEERRPAGQRKKRRTRWGAGSDDLMGRAEAAHQRLLENKPSHWQDVQVLGSWAQEPGNEHRRELVQKILFADAICGTHTSHKRLLQVIQLM